MSEDDLNIIENILQVWINDVAEIYSDKLHCASGQLWDSVAGFVGKTGSDYVAGLNLAEYWKYVEDGRQPGKFPPVEAIKQWIRSKSITPRPYTLSNGRTKVPSENQLAFLIGRKIATEGIPARPYLQQTVDALKQNLFERLNEAVAEDVINQLVIEFNS